MPLPNLQIKRFKQTHDIWEFERAGTHDPSEQRGWVDRVADRIKEAQNDDQFAIKITVEFIDRPTA